MRRKEQFDKQILKAKNQYAKRCEVREALKESYIKKNTQIRFLMTPELFIVLAIATFVLLCTPDTKSV